MKQDVFNEMFRNRTKSLALGIIRELEGIKYSDALGVIRKQLIRSVTFTTANFREVFRARSEGERFSKLCIVVEETVENLFWMKLMVDGEFVLKEKMKPFYHEAEDILIVMSAFKSKLKP